MEKRDYLKDQIEHLGRVLGKIITDILGLESQGAIHQFIAVANVQLKEELDIDISSILKMNKNELKEYVILKNMTSPQIELLSHYFMKMGENTSPTNENSRVHFMKSLELLHIADEVSGVFSLDRHRLQKIVKQKIQGGEEG